MKTRKIKLIFLLSFLIGIIFTANGQSISIDNIIEIKNNTNSADLIDNNSITHSTVTYLSQEDYYSPTIPVRVSNKKSIKKTNKFYCSSSANNNNLEWITGVVIGSFSNISNAKPYSDFSDMEVNLTPGTENNIVLTPGYSGSSEKEFWRIWIDFNNDGIFDEVNEMVYKADNIKNTQRGIIAIPSNVSGKVRMRISMKKNGPPSPCKTFDNGEVEDYTCDFGDTKHVKSVPNKLYMELFPNSTKNLINIRLDSNEELINIKIYNHSGIEIKHIKTKSGEFKLNLTEFKNGTYYIEADNGTLNISKQFVVNN